MNQNGLKKVQGKFLLVQILSIWSTLVINEANMAKNSRKKIQFWLKKAQFGSFSPFFTIFDSKIARNEPKMLHK